MFEWNAYLLVIALLGGTFLAISIAMLRWAARNRQFDDLEDGARVIFTDEEPEGVQLDHFPGEADKTQRKQDT